MKRKINEKRNISDNTAKAIIAADKIITRAIYIFYPALLVFLAVTCRGYWSAGLLPYIIVPGVSFVMVSIFRNLYNAPRPYEEPGAPEPVIKKDSPGKSFPSRHVFSIFIIAVTAFQIWPAAGVVIAFAGIILAIIRVVGGVHYPRDVIAGALTGVILGFLGYAIY